MLEQVGNGSEGNACRCGSFGEEHSAGHERVEAVFVIEGIHGDGEASAMGLGFEVGEETERMQMIGDEIAEPDADVEGSLIGGALRAEVPEIDESFDEGLGVLTFDYGDGMRPRGAGAGVRRSG